MHKTLRHFGWMVGINLLAMLYHPISDHARQTASPN